MFHCGVCNKLSKPRDKIGGRKVVEMRYKHYPIRARTYRALDAYAGKLKWKDDPGGEGWEIAKETLACKECAADEINHVV